MEKDEQLKGQPTCLLLCDDLFVFLPAFLCVSLIVKSPEALGVSMAMSEARLKKHMCTSLIHSYVEKVVSAGRTAPSYAQLSGLCAARRSASRPWADPPGAADAGGHPLDAAGEAAAGALLPLHEPGGATSEKPSRGRGCRFRGDLLKGKLG